MTYSIYKSFCFSLFDAKTFEHPHIHVKISYTYYRMHVCLKKLKYSKWQEKRKKKSHNYLFLNIFACFSANFKATNCSSKCFPTQTIPSTCKKRQIKAKSLTLVTEKSFSVKLLFLFHSFFNIILPFFDNL